jgi:5-methylcytosine-specific restriction endonuclease McrA
LTQPPPMSANCQKTKLTLNQHEQWIRRAHDLIEEERKRRHASFETDRTAWREALSGWRQTSSGGGLTDEVKLCQIAKDLKKRGGFWGKFKIVEHLMGWLFHEGICVYCRADLIEADYITVGLATTDHLIPRVKRPDLDKDWLNAVPACSRCNGLKRHSDPTSEEGPTTAPEED